jgi:hypothetical protein
MRWGKDFLYVPLVGRDLLTLLPSAIPEPRIYPRGIWLTALPVGVQIFHACNAIQPGKDSSCVPVSFAAM